jgi:hypothetical protein
MVVTLGLTIPTELVMFPGLIVYVPPTPAPLPVMVALCPEQISVVDAAAVIVGCWQHTAR